ncbi:MAG: sialidase family protein [Candidatus Kapaibacterium sp.]|nr:exo-alpha-sialidase [Ignavibacteria bacterium]MCL4276595.1 glycoside hydrolase [Ignavibacteria bacterium]NOG67425.1 exo-alpha-sialidase [Chlorobiota bacterium]QOJ26250.1 MAG: exo-alpha-sialidase [Ignavibacteria bacterium]WKZ76991.1 MAG: sialidase family protein [Candidatus Kapabacteria bacterium]
MILLVAFAAHVARAAGEDSVHLDSLYLKGARGMVPCNDGSFVGGYINCPTFPPGYYESDHCDRPVLTRSWDGGKTWVVEDVGAPTYAYSGIVRLRGGVLLTAHNSWLYGFLTSTDNGRTWQATFDTTQATPVLSVGEVIGMLFRDHRGLLYWKLGGELHVSLDNGKTFIWLRYSDLREGYYVLPTDGLLVTHTVGSGSSPGSIQMSFNHGRSWSQTLKGYDQGTFGKEDSMSTLTGCVIIRDTVAVDDRFGYYPDGGHNYQPIPRTMYWHRKEHVWTSGRFLQSFGINGIMDSTECWFTGAFATLALGPEDTVQRAVSRDIPVDSIPPEGDTMIYTRGRLYDHFYDLDGNIHPHGSNVYVPRRAPRPVSRLDRLYTCTGVEYVVGGHHLDTVILDPSRSVNARLSYTITPNKRLSTIVIEAVDTTRPMHFTMMVDDSITGRQWFSDSVMTVTKPVVALGRFYLDTILTCTYPEGPFMWYYNDTLMPHRIVGANADSVIFKPKPGKYKVMAKSPFGCDVWSNEVSITTTAIEESGDSENGRYSAYPDNDGNIHVRWTGFGPTPSSITVFDILGRRLEADVRISGNEAVVDCEDHQKMVLIMISTGKAVHVLRVLRPQ